MTLYKKPPHEKRLRRKTQIQRKLVLIVCCGETESLFFQKIKRSFRGKLQLTVRKVPKDPNKILSTAIELKKQLVQDHAWIVIDKDNFPNIDRLLLEGRRAHVKVIFSNPCFELWPLLHFEYLDTTTSSTDLIKRLEKAIKSHYKFKTFKYNKTDPNLYERLIELKTDAIRHAKKLMQHWQTQPNKSIDSHNPSTNIFEIFEDLEKL